MPNPIIGIGEILWDLLPSGPRAGGAPFNFAFHCLQLGHSAVIVSRVGDDELGRELRREVRRLGMSDQFIQIDPKRPTGTVTVQVDSAGQPSYTICDNVAWDYLEWSEPLAELAQCAPAVCFGTLASRHDPSRSTILQFIAQAKSAIRICDFNMRPPFVHRATIRRLVESADWLKMNDHEAVELAGLIAQEPGDRTIVETRGSRGCVITRGIERVEVVGIPIQVADTVGAGDSFAAALITQILEGRTLAESANFANRFAALVASRTGGTPAIDRRAV